MGNQGGYLPPPPPLPHDIVTAVEVPPPRMHPMNHHFHPNSIASSASSSPVFTPLVNPLSGSNMPLSTRGIGTNNSAASVGSGRPRFACNYCRRLKARCDGGRPCKLCSKRGRSIQCVQDDASEEKEMIQPPQVPSMIAGRFPLVSLGM
jgi:hypothetical protein